MYISCRFLPYPVQQPLIFSEGLNLCIVYIMFEVIQKAKKKVTKFEVGILKAK